MADVRPKEPAIHITDGNGEKGKGFLARHIVPHGVVDVFISRGPHLEVHTINGAHLPSPEVTACGSTKAQLELCQRISIIDREVHVLEVSVDGIHRQPNSNRKTWDLLIL